MRKAWCAFLIAVPLLADTYPVIVRGTVTMEDGSARLLPLNRTNLFGQFRLRTWSDHKQKR